MELMPGYQKTEVGIIPVDWKTTSISDLVEPSAPICYGVVQVGQHTESGIPIVAIKFVKDIANAPLHRTAVSLEQPYTRSRPKDGDVLISIKGTIGRVGIVPNGFNGNISRELARLRIRSEFCPQYIAHQLESGATQERIMRSVVGTTRLEFSIATLRKFTLPVPPNLTEQHVIAEALSDVDALLDSLDSIIAKKRDLKQAAMQQLLTGQTRLPGFKTQWNRKPLGELIIPLKKTNRPSSVGKNSGTYPFFTNTTKPVDRFLDELDFNTEAIIANTGGESYFNYCNGGFAAMADCFVFETTLATTYLYYFLKLNQQAINNNGFTGSGIKHLDKKFFAQLEVPHPSEFTEQNAIAEVLKKMDKELVALEQRRQKTHDVKQGMMQELLTGRTRLV
jgi:type I restriction enzyme S subunit